MQRAPASMATSSAGMRMRLLQGVVPVVPLERKEHTRMAWLYGTWWT